MIALLLIDALAQSLAHMMPLNSNYLARRSVAAHWVEAASMRISHHFCV
jgi:hypothetical protein